MARSGSLPLAAKVGFCWVATLMVSLCDDVGAGEIRRSAHAVAGEYIVVLKRDAVPADDVGTVAAGMRTRFGTGAIRNVYRTALRGFSADMSEEQARDLANDPRVAYVQENGVVVAMGLQSDAPWGLDRIDQRNLPLSGTYSFDGAPTSGVNVYVVDTGIRTTHVDFSGHAEFGFDNTGEGPGDCNGHGTADAAIAGGGRFGAAKGVRLWAVKVLNCSGTGTFEGVIRGIEWVYNRPETRKIAFLGFGGGANQALDDAVVAAIGAGTLVVVAAGNSNADACNFSPSGVPDALTVAATDASDNRATFSNFGTCVDLFAPGLLIPTAWNTSDTATRTISGTTFAAAHAAGAAALYWAGHPSANEADVRSALLAAATQDAISNAGAGSPNRLLYTGGLFTCPGTPASAVLTGGARIPFGRSTTVHVSISGGTPPFTVVLTHGGGYQTTSASEIDFTVGPQASTVYGVEWISDANNCAASATGLAVIDVLPLQVPTASSLALFLLAFALVLLAMARMTRSKR